MSLIIKNSVIIKNNWNIIKFKNIDNFKKIVTLNKKIVVHLNIWKKYSYILKNKKKIGIWIFSNEKIQILPKDILKFKIIIINFLNFSDGRAYTIVYNIRNYLNYFGEIRAIGDVLRDQLFFMKRIGFNSFSIRNDKNICDTLNGLFDFSEKYQVSNNKSKPLFLRKNRKFKNYNC